jgi:hypothetical protein
MGVSILIQLQVLKSGVDSDRAAGSDRSGGFDRAVGSDGAIGSDIAKGDSLTRCGLWPGLITPRLHSKLH